MPDLRRLRVGVAAAAAVIAAAGLADGPHAPYTPHANAAPADIAGMIVFLDPAESGANDARQVPDGRGGTKDCQASGTATDDRYPEHSFTWEVVLRIRSLLNQLGVRTAMSRGNDDGLGPCVDERAATANGLHPDAIVSIDADGGPPSGRGFDVNYSAPPLNQAQAGPAVQFARIMRDQLRASGTPPANYIGQDGLYPRADVVGLNLAQYPAILVELGNMKNPADDALITTPDGRQKYAAAVVNGIAGFLATSKAV